jgi:hypothetical protein
LVPRTGIVRFGPTLACPRSAARDPDLPATKVCNWVV